MDSIRILKEEMAKQAGVGDVLKSIAKHINLTGAQKEIKTVAKATLKPAEFRNAVNKLRKIRMSGLAIN